MYIDCTLLTNVVNAQVKLSPSNGGTSF